jgi:hypothetical protein
MRLILTPTQFKHITVQKNLAKGVSFLGRGGGDLSVVGSPCDADAVAAHVEGPVRLSRLALPQSPQRGHAERSSPPPPAANKHLGIELHLAYGAHDPCC